MIDETRRLDEDPDDPDATATYVHFGPGVPVPKAPAPDRATALWRGEADPASADTGSDDPALARRGRTQRWILPLTVLILVIAVLIYFFWGHAANPATLSVNGVTVQVSAPVLDCGGTERVTAVINTNGGAGTVEYRWMRSDGTASGQISQPVASGDRHVSVVLDWNFDGYGELDASATVRIISPGAGAGGAMFKYRCVKQ
jgi:hypothetical protein